jgi:hypothetical protein
MQPKDQQPPQEKSAARLWSRIEQIDRRREKVIAALDAERAELTAKLDKILYPDM